MLNYRLSKLIIPILTFILLSSIVISIYVVSINKHYKVINEQLSETGQLISKEFDHVLTEYVNKVESIKQRIVYSKGNYFNYWKDDAESYVKRNPSFKFIQYIDSTMVIKDVVPLKNNQEAVELNISNIRGGEWLSHVQGNTVNVSSWISLSQGGQAFLVDAPIYIDSKFYGTITAGLDFTYEFDKFLKAFQGQYVVEIYDEKGNLFYHLNSDAKLKSKRDLEFANFIKVDIQDYQFWKLKVYPSNKLLFNDGKVIINWALLVGIVLSLIVALLVHFYLKAKRGTNLVTKSYQELVKANKILNFERNKAEEASQAKTDFISNMSHEIRTPLHAISGFIEILKSSDLSVSDKEYIALMEQSAVSLLYIIDNILSVQQAQNKGIILSRDIFQPETKIKELIELNKHAFHAKNMYLKASYKNLCKLKVEGDQAKYIRIISNLLENALKFTKTGGATLSYNEELLGSSKLKVTITIKDTGIGVPEDKVANIFDEFNITQNIITKEYDGTGLGLAISKTYVNLLNGEISVKSESNKGSTFEFYVIFDIVSGQEKIKGDIISNKPQFNYSNLNILIVDDNKLNILVLKKFLKNLNMQTDCAYNGVEALDKFNKKNYDLIFMDIHMPVMDGWQASKEIRKSNSEVVIFALSANITTQALKMAKESGMDNYLTKPFSKGQITKLLHQYFN